MTAGRPAVAHDGREVAFAVLAEALAGLQQVLRVEACLDTLCQLDLVGGVEQRRLADAVQVHAHQISGWTLSIQILVDAA
jgi:hypothetical protein